MSVEEPFVGEGPPDNTRSYKVEGRKWKDFEFSVAAGIINTQLLK